MPCQRLYHVDTTMCASNHKKTFMWHATSTSVNGCWQEGPKVWSKNINRIILWRKYFVGLKMKITIIFMKTKKIFNPKFYYLSLFSKLYKVLYISNKLKNTIKIVWKRKIMYNFILLLFIYYKLKNEKVEREKSNK